MPGEIALIAAEPWAYRNRIRVAFDAAGNPGYRGRRSHAVIPISECPIAAPLLIMAAQAAAEVARQITPAIQPVEIALFCDAGGTSLLASLFIAGARKVRFDKFAQALHRQIPTLKGAELVVEGHAGQSPRTI